MNRLILSFFALTFATTAWAGPNAGGVLALDAVPEIEYSDVDNSLCGAIGDNVPSSCGDLVTNISTEVSIWQILAIFPDGSSPRLAGVSFGIAYDDAAIVVFDWEHCGDFELFTNDWPLPGNGATITWSEAQTTQVTQIYSFAGYSYYGVDTTFDFGPNPVGPDGFGDDDVPANVDPVEAYGSLGFYNEPGYAPCFDDAPGACCLPDGECVVVFQGDCEPGGGEWQGGGTTCDPNPCPPSGACCLSDGSCVELTRSACDEEGGLFYENEPCSDEICEAVPVVESSWGQIKRSYR